MPVHPRSAAPDPRSARAREVTAAEYVPHRASLAELRAASQACRGCELYANATQTVFGQGKRGRLMLVGEQPGDEEDRAGLPFVGPSGRLLDSCLERAGIDRKAVYVTNAVKHFKWEARGKRRLHKTPSARELRACTPWLHAEIEAVKPEIVVCLGATATQALLGPSARVTQLRGEFVPGISGTVVFVTLHPAAILRTRSETERKNEELGFVADLEVVAERLGLSRSTFPKE